MLRILFLCMSVISAIPYRSVYYDLNSTFTMKFWPKWDHTIGPHYHCPSEHECPFDPDWIASIECKRENHTWTGCWAKFPMRLAIDTIDIQCERPTEALSNWIIADTCNLYYTTKQLPAEQPPAEQIPHRTSDSSSETLFIMLPFVIVGLFALIYKTPQLA